MRMLSGVCGFVAATFAFSAAWAQVSQTYSYDGNGRLIAVATTSPGGSHNSTYTYDDADNRLTRSQVGTGVFAQHAKAPFVYAARLNLVVPEGPLQTGQWMQSARFLDDWAVEEVGATEEPTPGPMKSPQIQTR